jgi:hypothetical protein
MSDVVAKEYQEKCDQVSKNIKQMFADQAAAAQVCIFYFQNCTTQLFQAPWDKDHFSDLVTKWVAACDQPFIAVNRPEFRDMVRYAALHPADKRLSIPKGDTVKSKIRAMETEMVKELCQTFKVVLES